MELLKKLPDHSVNLIYCDVLYNTGRVFKTKDNEVAYDDRIGTENDVLDFYKARLSEMKRVLKDDGTILVHCDYRISPYIQVTLNNIFGKNNFQDKIIWKKTETGKGAKALKALSKDYDEILYYVKSDKFTANKLTLPHNSISLQEFKYFDDEKQQYFKIVNLGVYSKISVDKMKEEGLIHATKSGKEYKKYYLTDFKNSCISDIWVDCHNLYNGNNGEMNEYPTQKPKALLERIIHMFSNEGDIIADFFMGSGTTGEVAVELGRKFIGCDLGEKACEISKDRLSNLN